LYIVFLNRRYARAFGATIVNGEVNYMENEQKLLGQLQSLKCLRSPGLGVFDLLSRYSRQRPDLESL